MWVNAAPRLAMPRAAGASPRSPANFVTLLGPILQSMRSSLSDGDSITASGAMLAASPCDDRREQRRFGTVLEKRGNATYDRTPGQVVMSGSLWKERSTWLHKMGTMGDLYRYRLRFCALIHGHPNGGYVWPSRAWGAWNARALLAFISARWHGIV